MKIRDYEIIHNIDILFEKTLIIYGMGHLGKRIVQQLEELSINVEYFCDSNPDIYNDTGATRVTIDELKDITSLKECMIIIGTQTYQDEIIELLDKTEIQAYVCTWYGIQAGIELNLLNNKRFMNVKDKLLFRKEQIHQSFWLQYLFKIFYDLEKYPHAIWIYQPGKVGSSSIRKTLINYNKKVVHFHWIKSNVVAEMHLAEIENLFKNQVVRVESALKNKRTTKIITLVRDPLARELSEFMQRFMTEYVNLNIRNNIKDSAREFIEKRLIENDEYMWFDRELKELTGIDVYAYPFNKEKGYAWIRKDNVEILILKMEQMNENSEVIGEFIGVSNLIIEKDNIGSQKHYKYIYEELKNELRISRNVVYKTYMENSRMDHFYTLSEKQKFLHKWECNIE